MAARALDMHGRSPQSGPDGPLPGMRTTVRVQTPTSRRPSMSPSDAPSVPAPEAGRPLVFRGGTVLTMDASSTVLTDADVLVVGDRIQAVGPALEVPAGTPGGDAPRGGWVAPGVRDPPAPR